MVSDRKAGITCMDDDIRDALALVEAAADGYRDEAAADAILDNCDARAVAAVLARFVVRLLGSPPRPGTTPAEMAAGLRRALEP